MSDRVVNELSDIPLVPLDLLRRGERGRVAAIDGPAVSVNRLHELGLHAGQPVTMLRPGPPHLVLLGDTRLVLRAESDIVVLVGLGQE